MGFLYFPPFPPILLQAVSHAASLSSWLILPSCYRWVMLPKYKSHFQLFWLKKCGYFSPVGCFFFLKLLHNLSLPFHHIPVFHVILTSCVCEDAKSAFSRLLHIIMLETVFQHSLPKSVFLLISTNALSQSLSTHFLPNPTSPARAGNKRRTFCLWCSRLAQVNIRT